MVDQSDKGSSECDEMSNKTETCERVLSSDGTNLKTCVDCGTSKTPLWRGGPAGPKSLCNACGIRSRKKRRALLMDVTVTTKQEKKPKKSTSDGAKSIVTNTNQQSSSSNSSTSSSGDCTSNNLIETNTSKKHKLWVFGRDVVLQRPRSHTHHRRRLGEEEQAAILLMAMSCGSVYA